ncbi:MAG: hypothetical protein PHC97_02260 [Patescibacteria group bacterium]|nr:hypothetical protein [Patescibacteria group bacterium]
MKRLGLYLILGAIVTVVADFLTLGNRQFIAQSQSIDQLALLVFVVAALLFLIGLVKLIKDLFLSEWLKKRKEKIKKEIGTGERVTHAEGAIRIILAVLVVLLVIPISVIIPLIGLIISIPQIFLAGYLFFNKRHHLIFNSFLLLAGIYLFFFSGANPFQSYKLAEFSLIPGSGETMRLTNMLLSVLSVGGKFLFMLSASWLVFTDILVKVKNQIFDRHRGLVNFATLLVLVLVLLFLPYAYQPQVKLGEGTSGGTSGDGASHFAMNNTSTNMAFEQKTGQYIFTAILINATDQTGPIIRIVVDAQDLEISPSNKNLIVENGTISNNLISIAAGQTGILKIFSGKPFYCVTIMEKDFKYGNCFLK